MKLAQVNGINVCELVFLPELDALSTFFKFQTIYQAGDYSRY